MADSIEAVAEFHNRLSAAMAPVLVGQEQAIEHVIIAIACGGHVLLTGGAASGKGLLVRALAKAAQLDFRRIQFTPDLMPSDITGSEILEESAATGHRVKRFVPGPIFTNLLMADEINRTPPKTQSALLEGMQEKQVTAGGRTMPLPVPFFVMATRTSIETEGIYPLPEAQQDRFMFNVEMRPLSQDEEHQIVMNDPAAKLDRIEPVVDKEQIVSVQRLVRDVAVPEAVQRYIVDLTCASRPGTPDAGEMVNRYVAWGAGVRASQYLALGAKARAAMRGRSAAAVEDVKAVALPVMRHRIGLNFRAENDGITAARVVNTLVETVKN